MIRIIILLTCITILSGCSTWRGIPSHGGGKRFDEEQRVVAGAIRKAIADMNVNELRGLKVQVNIEAMAQNGGGQLLLPGIDSISTGYNNFETNDKSNSLQIQEGWNAGVTISTDAELRPTVFTTEGDLKYFEAALNMKLLHSGVNFTAKNPDCILYVLVDVLGTNRSREDSLIYWKDSLRATCELTYYAVEPQTNYFYFPARQSSAESTYFEKSAFMFNTYQTGRNLEAVKPTVLPVDGNFPQAPLRHSHTQSLHTAEPNNTAQSQFTKMRKQLEQKLIEANSYLQSGDLEAAEKTINDIRSVDPEYPGLDSVSSNLEAAKSQMPNN